MLPPTTAICTGGGFSLTNQAFPNVHMHMSTFYNLHALCGGGGCIQL